MHDLDPTTKKDELEYTNFRIEKNRPTEGFMFMLWCFCVAAFAGIFSTHKAIIMGTSIPIALVSGIELSVGMLTEFRLREYFRILMK